MKIDCVSELSFRLLLERGASESVADFLKYGALKSLLSLSRELLSRYRFALQDLNI